jgi:hypothetical protein
MSCNSTRVWYLLEPWIRMRCASEIPGQSPQKYFGKPLSSSVTLLAFMALISTWRTTAMFSATRDRGLGSWVGVTSRSPDLEKVTSYSSFSGVANEIMEFIRVHIKRMVAIVLGLGIFFLDPVHCPNIVLLMVSC